MTLKFVISIFVPSKKKQLLKNKRVTSHTISEKYIMRSIKHFLSDHRRGRCLMDRIIILSCSPNRMVSPKGGSGGRETAYCEDNLRKYRPCKMIRGK